MSFNVKALAADRFWTNNVAGAWKCVNKVYPPTAGLAQRIVRVYTVSVFVRAAASADRYIYLLSAGEIKHVMFVPKGLRDTLSFPGGSFFANDLGVIVATNEAASPVDVLTPGSDNDAQVSVDYRLEGA